MRDRMCLFGRPVCPEEALVDCIQDIEVESLGHGGWRLGWQPNFSARAVAVYWGPQPDAIDPTALVSGAHGTAELRLPAACVRPYFELVAEDGARIVVAERQVPLVGGVNFRDLGGYQTRQGTRLRWGRLFRSGHMSRLTAADQTLLTALGIRTVCDFRMAEERANENATLSCEPTLETLGIPPGLKDRFFLHRLFEQTDDPAVVVEAMHEIMRSLILECAPHYARLFDALLGAADGSVLMNCSAGKERTGVGAALLLLALGVPRTTILYDFALSRRYFPAASELPRAREKYNVQERPGRDVEALMAPLLFTRESYLEAVFGVIDERYGDDDRFLRQAMGVGEPERARLRDRFTS